MSVTSLQWCVTVTFSQSNTWDLIQKALDLKHFEDNPACSEYCRRQITVLSRYNPWIIDSFGKNLHVPDVSCLLNGSFFMGFVVHNY